MTAADWSAWAEHHEPWIRRFVWTVFLVALFAFLVRGADRPADPHLASSGRRLLPGFEELRFRVTTADGRELDWCALLAATRAARQQGLMQQRDLLGYDAMVFRFEGPSTGAFYMYRTPLPLSIAWFDGEGRFISASDMEPCPETDAAACPVYPAAAPYHHALEVTRGGLGALGVGPDSRLSFPGGSCDVA